MSTSLSAILFAARWPNRVSLTSMRPWRRAILTRKLLPPFLRSIDLPAAQESLPLSPKAPRMRLLLSSLVLCCSLVCLSHNPRYHGHHGAVIGEDTYGLPSRWVLHRIPCLCSLCAPPFGTRESSEVLPACSAEHSLSVPVSLQHRVLIMLSTSLLKKEIHCTHFCRWAVQGCLLSPLNIVELQVLCCPASSLDSGRASRASPFLSASLS